MLTFAAIDGGFAPTVCALRLFDALALYAVLAVFTLLLDGFDVVG